MPLQKNPFVGKQRQLLLYMHVMSEEAIRIRLELVESAETYSEQVNEKA